MKPPIGRSRTPGTVAQEITRASRYADSILRRAMSERGWTARSARVSSRWRCTSITARTNTISRCWLTLRSLSPHRARPAEPASCWETAGIRAEVQSTTARPVATSSCAGSSVKGGDQTDVARDESCVCRRQGPAGAGGPLSSYKAWAVRRGPCCRTANCLPAARRFQWTSSEVCCSSRSPSMK